MVQEMEFFALFFPSALILPETLEESEGCGCRLFSRGLRPAFFCVIVNLSEAFPLPN